MTHYERLDIEADASSAEVREAFRRAVRALHPDRHGEETTAEMASVNRAWWVLSDPARRGAYDAALARERETRSRQEEAAGAAKTVDTAPAPFWDPEVDFEDDVPVGMGDHPATNAVARLRSLVVIWGVLGAVLVGMLFLYGFCRSGVSGG